MLTDIYSLGLLLWRISGDGVNPFEKLGIISSEWSEDAKLKTVRALKENDLVYPLYRDDYDRDAPEIVKDFASSFLKKDPLERLKTMEETVHKASEVMTTAIQSVHDNPNPDTHTQYVMEVLEYAQGQLREDADLSQSEEEQDPFELLSFGSLFSRRSFVPDCVSIIYLLTRTMPLHSHHQPQDQILPQQCIYSLFLTISRRS